MGNKRITDEMKTIGTAENFNIKMFRIFKEIQGSSNTNKNKTVSQNTNK